jgi:heme-degrading monooxygenase HmoA
MYVAVWKFSVRPECESAFESAYRADGDWNRLFRQAPGYRSTELLRIPGEPRHYLTIDRWESERDWQDFRQRFAAEYQALDRRCEQWTDCEEPVAAGTVI